MTQVDWTRLPEPADDGAAAHLTGMDLPDLNMPATTGPTINLSDLRGITVLYLYPMTGRPDRDLPENWDDIPGARGCTPQSCAFRDHFAKLRDYGVDQLLGISTQDTAYQTEAAERLHLPFPLLSDADGKLRAALELPTMTVEGDVLLSDVLLKRLTMIARDGVIEQVFYPVFPPDQDADNVIDSLRSHAE
jgi:peroxiredoxin